MNRHLPIRRRFGFRLDRIDKFAKSPAFLREGVEIDKIVESIGNRLPYESMCWDPVMIGNMSANYSNDEHLLDRIACGDRQAFASFYDRYSGHTLGLLLGILRKRADAEDVLQETFLQIWRQAGRYDAQRGSPRVWISRIARSRAIDAVRRKGTRAIPTIDVDELSENTSDIASKNEMVRVATGALERLDPPERESIRLAFFGGLTQEQIAESTDTPLGTVKTRIRRGMQKLRANLNGHRRGAHNG